ncbi:hypothetical protein [Gemmatimonas sp.]|jgi:hypothetical protein|uniref:hypothetical protein n=1 Tax=Gemmatimonas sp. TaxID=1962908 RepID=UPI0037BEB165
MNRRITVFALTLFASAMLARPVEAQGKPTTVRGESAGTVGAPAPAVKAERKTVTPTEITIERESFAYSGSGRRDPYKSLMSSSDVRPLLSDLRLTAVAFDPDGNNSVAILRDSYSKTQYRVRVGQQLGRLRVSGIRQKAVQFSIEEFGFNRQETLPLSSDTTKVRNP